MVIREWSWHTAKFLHSTQQGAKWCRIFTKSTKSLVTKKTDAQKAGRALQWWNEQRMTGTFSDIFPPGFHLLDAHTSWRSTKLCTVGFVLPCLVTLSARLMLQYIKKVLNRGQMLNYIYTKQRQHRTTLLSSFCFSSFAYSSDLNVENQHIFPLSL